MGLQLGQVILFHLISFIQITMALELFRRDPSSLLKPSKSPVPDDNKAETLKASATRNIILIRHGQYNLSGVKDDERYLTALGISFQ